MMLKQQQWARVPIELLQLVDANALQLYVAIVSHTSADKRTCYPSNERLCELTGQSLATLKRSLSKLVDCGAISRTGRRRRVLVVVNQLSSEPIDELNQLTGEPRKGSRVSRPTEPEVSEPETHSLRSCEPATDESESDMHDETTEALFDVELPPEPEKPIGAAALAAFFDAYGDEPISRPMIGRLGREFKRVGETYDRELVLRAAHELGVQRCANPQAVESFVLRLRRQATPQQQQASGWSQLAAQAFDRWEHDSAQTV
jgi:hypothetical protein